ncbi:protein kinase [Streptomyces sp. NPDC051976]|uniref:protein kinase domain-containing protein n=1 Tax=Streptomyces sp. NPDC051976 TaxID=3154947 RepID=UPI00343B1150
MAAYGFGNHDGRPYLVMELVEGRSLTEELRACGPLEAARAADVAAQTARGLAAAHQQSVVHRDIKPGNLMLATDGTVKNRLSLSGARLHGGSERRGWAAGHYAGSEQGGGSGGVRLLAG